MLTKRIIPCLDVRDGRVVKGVQFENLTDVGDPAELAVRYEEAGADEIVFLDITATLEGRAMMRETVRKTAERLFIPLTVGGGIRTYDDVRETLRAGADHSTRVPDRSRTMIRSSISAGTSGEITWILPAPASMSGAPINRSEMPSPFTSPPPPNPSARRHS